MSTLTDALNRLETWLLQNPSATVSLYGIQVGLSREQIEEIARKLPFILTEEIYELYQWSNGGLQLNLVVQHIDENNEVYHYRWEYGFHSLEYALAEMGNLNCSNYRLMPIGWRQCDAGTDCINVVLGAEVSTVLYFDYYWNYYSQFSLEQLRDKYGRFNSLTEMIQELADCCESAEKDEERIYQYQVEARRFPRLLN